MKIPKDWTFKSADVAKEFDRHVREQLPWYDLATGVITHVARHYIPHGGTVYDIGASTGNIGKSLADIIKTRSVNFIPIDSSETMKGYYSGPGDLIIADACNFHFEPFDFAVCFLVLMFLPVSRRRSFLRHLRSLAKEGGAIVVFDKCVGGCGYASSVISKLALAGKLAAGIDSKLILAKEMSLAGVQRPIEVSELGVGAQEIFRFGDFGGWILESNSNQ